MEKIGRYEIIGELGKGAMGVVYKATDPTIGRTVAVKTLRLEFHGDDCDEMLARFKNEARAAGMMNHPNLITIYDAGEHEAMFYIAMEFIEGQTLQALLKNPAALPAEKIIDIGRQVLTGLDYAHGRGIIHRDIKPANIMVTADGTVKVMDFGIAKRDGTGMTSTGQVVGTPNYMSPEQVRGLPVDGRTDLFSVGVILYEMLTRQRPFTSDNVATIIYKIVHENPVAPRDLNAGVDPGLSAVVMKALCKSPEDRYGTGAEFAKALQNYRSVQPEPATFKPATPVTPPMAPAPMRPTIGLIPRAATPARFATAAAAGPPTALKMRAPAAIEAAAPATVFMQTAAAPKKHAVLVPLVIAVMLLAGVIAIVRLHRSAQKVVEMTNAEIKSGTEPPPQPAPPSPAPARGGRETPPAKAALAAESGALQISSTPFGATVTIDGHGDPDWQTPFAATRLKPGKHTVSFLFKGYDPETRQVEVVAGMKIPVVVQLQLAQGFLNLDSDPAGAAIYVDGRDSGQVTPSRLTVNEGQHRIALRKDGFKPQIKYADVTRGQTFTFAPSLLPLGAAQDAIAASGAQSAGPFRRLRRLLGGGAADGGVLEVRTRPRGAEIQVGDSAAPWHTPARFPLAPGTYALTLSLPGYKPVTRSVQIEKGKITDIEAVFQPQ